MVFKTKRSKVHPTSNGTKNKGGAVAAAAKKTPADKLTVSTLDGACEDFIISLLENLHKVQAQNLTDEKIEDMIEAFSAFDEKGDGTITKANITIVLQSLDKNPTKQQLDEIMTDDGQDVIDFIAFLEMMDRIKYDFNDAVKEAFYIFDSDGSGAISFEKFRRVMMTLGAQMTDEEVNEIIDEVDDDGDGQINFDEFINMLKGAL